MVKKTKLSDFSNDELAGAFADVRSALHLCDRLMGYDLHASHSEFIALVTHTLLDKKKMSNREVSEFEALSARLQAVRAEAFSSVNTRRRRAHI